MGIIENETIAIWFSCGAASAVAAKKTIELYGDKNKIIILNNPIREEDDDNLRFLFDVQKWLGVKIEFVSNPKYPHNSAVAIWEHRRFMSGPNGAPCTGLLKIEARQAWEKNNHAEWHVLGFTADEKKRHDNFILQQRNNVIPVLINEGITKADCYKIIKDAGIELPRVYLKGYPNANCIGCVKATSPTYWNHVRENDPDVFELREKQSREIGAKLVRVKGKRIFLDELNPKATGRPLKNMDFECGIFCQLEDIE